MSVDPFDNAPASARFEALARLRREAPVSRSVQGPWFVTSQQGVLDGLRQVESFVGSFGETGDRPEEEQVMAAIAEPRHGRVRKVINSVLAYHHASKVEPFVRQLASRLIEETLRQAAEHGEVDLVEHYTRPIPSSVIANVLGVPARDYARFAIWSDEVLAAQGASDDEHTGMAEIHPVFAAYVDGLIQERLDADQPTDDLVTRMLFTEVDGERLTPRMVRTQTMFLIIAGNETTRNLIGSCLHRLATEPGAYDQVRADPAGLLPRVIEETLRLDSPVQLLARSCTSDVQLDGHPVVAGERVLHSIASANRDETRYDQPDRFRLDRPEPRDHVAFGAGAHICPGAFLARMETQVALEVFLDAVSHLELAPDYRWDPNPVFWALGPRTLRVRLKV